MKVFDLIGAAERFADLMAQPVISVDSKRCSHTKNKSSACQICVDGCPVGAINVEGQQVSLAAESCVQCGLCLHSCPTGTFTGGDAEAKLIDCIKPLARGQVVEIACPYHPQADTRLAVSQHKILGTRCLAAYGVSTYLTLKAKGVHQVVLRLDACAQCPIAAVEGAICEIASRTNALLAGADPFVVPVRRVEPDALLSRPAQHSRDKQMSRRELFQLFRKAPAEVSPELPTGPANGDGLAAGWDDRLPAERARLVTALRQLSPTSLQRDSTPFEALKAGHDCTACGVCAFACPTGALRIAWGDTTFELTFASGACTGCGLCTTLCPVKTLTFDGRVPVEQAIGMEPVTVASGALKRCRRCKAPFAASDSTELCPLCEYRRLVPFGMAQAKG